MATFSFVVLKVNGADITNIPLDEAFQRMLTATEPIALEVERKSKNVDNDVDTKVKSPSGGPEATDSVSSSNEMILTFKPTDVGGRASSTVISSKCTQTEDNEFIYTTERQEITDRLIEQEHNIFEQCLAPDIDIEEITLRKSDSNERLGLTVYYNGCSNNSSGNNINSALSGSDDNEMCTEVFISDIQPDSIAGRDGRLRQGDQILQINGKDIKNKEETETLIAENNNAVTLLVSRYLYTDEDDFNDPAVIDLEVDEDDEEEYYEENNIGYENCFVASDYINAVDDLDKAFLAQAMQQVTLSDTERCTTMTTTTVKSVPVNSTDNNNESTTTKSVNTKSKSVKIAEQAATPYAKGDRNEMQSATKAKANKHAATPNLDYETEHIYETIPEDFEAEPFYCSPYESSTYVTAGGSCSSAATDALQLQQQHQKQRVAQWLGMKPHNLATTTPRQSSRDNINGCGRNSMRHRSVTVSTHSSHGVGGAGGAASAGNGSNTPAINQCDDHDNSSSAYNTGGSNNSNTQPTFVQNQQHSRSDAVACNVDDEPFIAIRGSKILRIQSPKDKVTSPKNTAAMNKCSGVAVHITRGNTGPIYTSPHNPEIPQEMILRLHGGLANATIDAQLQQQQQQYSPKAMYTNESNFQQTVVSQQRLLRQTFMQQQQQQHNQQQDCKSAEQQMQPNAPCPHFTAPNLSQYHFVSSQQQVCANAVVLATKKNASEEAMVWKVKRRQDGTRYIVRRPARNRLLRHREIRLNTEHSRNNMTTTEDDTISEVKLGRYWSKEERRKHIERARERRQQQQRNLGTMMSGSCMSTIPISNKPATKLQRHPGERSAVQQQQPASVCLLRQLLPTAKTLQQHQLHFNSDSLQHQYGSPSASIACNAAAIDAHGSELAHVATTATTTTTDVTDIPYSAPSTGLIPHSTQMSSSTTISSDKANVLLSATTV